MVVPAFQAVGLPFGSEANEQRAKHLTQQRRERPGLRWSVAGTVAALARASAVARRARTGEDCRRSQHLPGGGASTDGPKHHELLGTPVTGLRYCSGE